jgi:4-amino-4-deoxy-L-arabinose transferase-like glycosyltransferase
MKRTELPRGIKRTRFLIIVAAVLHGFIHLMLFAPWMGEDEPWHVEYVNYVSEGQYPGAGKGIELTQDDLADHSLTHLLTKRRFPSMPYDQIEGTQHRTLQAMRDTGFWRRVDWAPPNSDARTFDQIELGFTAVNQPPLYYLLTGLLCRNNPGVHGGHWPEAVMRRARHQSLFLYVLTVLLTWMLARAAFQEGGGTLEEGHCAFAAVLVVLLMPIHSRHASIVNNDVLATMFATLLLALGARILARHETHPGPGRLSQAVLVVAVAALAVLTKMTAAGICALVVMVAFVSLVQGRPRGWWLLAGGLGTALIAAAVLYWNQQHNPALPRELATYIERVDRGFSLQSVYKLWGRFVGRLNWNSRSLPESVYTVTCIGFGLAFLSSVASLFRRPESMRRSVVLFCLAAVVAQAALVFLRGVPEGRYLVPALPAMGVLVAAGFVAPWKPERRRTAVAILAVLLLALDAIYLWRGVVLHHHLLWNA